MRDPIEDILKNARPAVLVDQTKNTGNAGNTGANNAVLGNVAQKLANSVQKYGSYSGEPTEAQKKYDEYFANYDPLKASDRVYYNSNGILSVDKSDIGKGSGSGGSSGGGNSGGGSNNSGLMADYKANLDDLYNKVMGYGGYQGGTFTPGTYTPGSSYTPTTFTAATYAPSVYSRTVDTSGTEALLNQSLNDIHNYGDFKYDLNADMLYQQAIDNYMMKGQQAAADTTAMASALTGGYGNSYAALVGNQAYQDHITQANNMIPQFQQAALNIWQSGYDRLLNDYNATSQQLANLLDIEGMNFNIWNANESNAANAFAMNEANRYNAWAQNEQNAFNAWLQNEQFAQDAFNINQNNAFNAWQQNEQNRLNEWQLGYGQAMDQYEMAKDYYATLEALQKASRGSGGSSSSGNKTSSNKNNSTTITNMNTGQTIGPLTTENLLSWIEMLDKANTKK